MADKKFIPKQNIQVSSNEEAVNAIRPGGLGWRSSSGDNKLTIVIDVADALRYGGSVRLIHPKFIESYDVVLLGGEKVQASKVSIF